MRRMLLLAALGTVEALALLLLWSFVCVWFGELEFPGVADALRFVRVGPSSVSEALFLFGLPVGVAAATVAFVAPFAPPIRLRSSGRSLRASVIAASFIGGGLAFGAMAALVELVLIASALDPVAEHFEREFDFLLVFSVAMALGWSLWTAALWKYGRRRDRSAISKLLSLVLRGTLIELAVAIPAYAYVRRKHDCYCSLGTFWALACGLGGLLFVAGPGALLLWQQRRGMWVDGSRSPCPKCGYERHRGAGRRCPECGTDWTTPNGSGTKDGRATDGI